MGDVGPVRVHIGAQELVNQLQSGATGQLQQTRTRQFNDFTLAGVFISSIRSQAEHRLLPAVDNDYTETHFLHSWSQNIAADGGRAALWSESQAPMQWTGITKARVDIAGSADDPCHLMCLGSSEEQLREQQKDCLTHILRLTMPKALLHERMQSPLFPPSSPKAGMRSLWSTTPALRARNSKNCARALLHLLSDQAPRTLRGAGSTSSTTHLEGEQTSVRSP